MPFADYRLRPKGKRAFIHSILHVHGPIKTVAGYSCISTPPTRNVHPSTKGGYVYVKCTMRIDGRQKLRMGLPIAFFAHVGSEKDLGKNPASRLSDFSPTDLVSNFFLKGIRVMRLVRNQSKLPSFISSLHPLTKTALNFPTSAYGTLSLFLLLYPYKLKSAQQDGVRIGTCVEFRIPVTLLSIGLSPRYRLLVHVSIVLAILFRPGGVDHPPIVPNPSRRPIMCNSTDCVTYAIQLPPGARFENPAHGGRRWSHCCTPGGWGEQGIGPGFTKGELHRVPQTHRIDASIKSPRRIRARLEIHVLPASPLSAKGLFTFIVITVRTRTSENVVETGNVYPQPFARSMGQYKSRERNAGARTITYNTWGLRDPVQPSHNTVAHHPDPESLWHPKR
ncbi:hypothetical protein BJ322DRAFT_1022709 [Thelephora terrestris]|uniref:Uncharacterized protein n=1 Tax=Thelephora terrestris TaxID=56493 RepID=A0A9P6H9Z0_9AGAM|nr:hypothetical protein BJ322DRAFT_1022709 [Thelephora terrestris]